ncbi:hypothetical protein [Bradyrhizobium elkanii]|uniref:hypothetical protein n=1 Tax=Bradyrhizobium elkanii TaxID=29448 RepID=UPI0030C6C389
MPTDSEKFTFVSGWTLRCEIDVLMRVRCWSLMLTAAFTLVFDERSADSRWLFGCWAVLVELLPVGDWA